MENIYMSHDPYFGFCVKKGDKILFAGKIEDCNKVCADLAARAKLLRMLDHLTALESSADLAESEYTAAPESAEKEAAFDAAFKKEFNALMDCVHELQEMTRGKVDFATAKKIVISKRADLVRLLDI